jgi:hypothetical protein
VRHHVNDSTRSRGFASDAIRDGRSRSIRV